MSNFVRGLNFIKHYLTMHPSDYLLVQHIYSTLITHTMEQTHIASVCSELQIKKITFLNNSQCNKTKLGIKCINNIFKKIEVIL